MKSKHGALPMLGGKKRDSASIRLGSRLDEDSIVSVAKTHNQQGGIHNHVNNANISNSNNINNSSSTHVTQNIAVIGPPSGIPKSITSPRIKKSVNIVDSMDQGKVLHSSLRAIGEQKLVYHDIPQAEVKVDYWNNNKTYGHSNNSVIVIEEFAMGKEKSVVIATGNFQVKDKVITYTVRQVLGSCLSVVLTVPLTKQNWVLFVPYTEQLEHLLRIYTRRARDNKKDNLNKLCASILNLTTVEFEDFLISRVDFNGDYFRIKYVKELANILEASAKSMQRFYRGYAMRKRFKKLVKAARLQKLFINKRNTRLYGAPKDNMNSSIHNPLINMTKTNAVFQDASQDDTNFIFDSFESGHNQSITLNQSQQAYAVYTAEAQRAQTASRAKTPYGNNTSRGRGDSTMSRDAMNSSKMTGRQQLQLGFGGYLTNNTQTINNTERLVFNPGEVDELKQEINDALANYQYQLECIHDFINQQTNNNRSHLQGGSQSMEMKASSKWLSSSPDNTASINLQTSLTQEKVETSIVADQVSSIRDVTVLQSELVSVVSKLENIESLYEHERKEKIILEHKYNDDISKARFAAELTSDRVAIRLKNEAEEELKRQLKELNDIEQEKRVQAVEVVKIAEEQQRMAREEDYMRNYNTLLNYENRIKQMKIELYLRDTAIEKEKQLSKSVAPSIRTKTDPSNKDVRVATDSSPTSKSAKSAVVTPAASTTDNDDEKPKSGFFRSLAKLSISSKKDDSSKQQKKPNLFDYIKMNSKKTAFGLLLAKDAVKDVKEGLTVEDAKRRVQKFFVNLIYQKRSGTMKDLRPIRLARQLEIVENTTHVKCIVIALKTSMDLLNEDLAVLSLKRFVALLSDAEQKSVPLAITPANVLVDVLEMFSMKPIVCTLCLEVIAEYVKVNTKTDPSQEIVKNFGTTALHDLLFSLATTKQASSTSAVNNDHVMIFRITKCLFLLSMSCDLCRNILRKENYVSRLIAIFSTHTKNNGVVENLLKIFIRIATDDSTLQDRLGTPEFIESLGTCFEVNIKVERLVIGICKLIVVMCSTNKKESQNLLSSSFYPILFSQCITVYKLKPKILEQVVWAMLSIVLNNKPAKRKFQDCGVLKKMLKLLDINKNGPSVVICGIWGISQMTTAGRPMLKEINAEIVQTLIKLREQKTHGEISRHAARLLIDTYSKPDLVVEDSPPTTPNSMSQSANAFRANDAFLNGSPVVLKSQTGFYDTPPGTSGTPTAAPGTPIDSSPFSPQQSGKSPNRTTFRL